MCATRVERMLTPAQLRKIWASARELGWDDELLHQELERVIGVTSLRDLSRKDAKLFIDWQVSLGASSGRHRAVSAQVNEPRPGPRPDNVIELGTPTQQGYIDELLSQLKCDRQDPYFLGALKRATGRTTVRTRRQASIAIEILKSLKARREGRPDEPGREGDLEMGTS